MNNLIEIAKQMPTSPGVYQFIDEHGDILYVGKAKNLKSRIKSYFLKELGRGPAIDIMVEAAKDIRYIETDSEIEAVILEANLINRLKPKYNVRLRDDKSFLVVGITKPVKGLQPGSLAEKDLSNKYSKIDLIRYKNIDLKDRKAEYFGPYPAGLLLKKSLHFLRKIFPYRDCSKTKFNTYRKKGRPCIYGDIRVCTAPCVDWVSQQEYQKNINYLKSFLKGRKKDVIVDLDKRMGLLSKGRRFEQAALIRDKLAALDHLKDVAIGLRDDVFNRSTLIFKRIECYDISNISGKYAVGAMVVFENGKKAADEYRRFKIKYTDELPNDLAMLKEVLERRFKNDWRLPDLIVIDGGENHLKVAIEVTKKNVTPVPSVSIAKGAKRDKNELHYSDAFIAKFVNNNKDLIDIIVSARDEAHRFAISYYRKLHEKGMFK